jgi:hypothetical protein
MDYLAGSLLFIAALTGVMPFTHLGMDMQLPQKMTLIHKLAFLAGFISLIIFSIFTDQHHKHYETLVMLTITLALGLITLTRSSIVSKKAWAISYAVVGMFSVLWLLTFLIKN